jgi:hypothetical protein
MSDTEGQHTSMVRSWVSKDSDRRRVYSGMIGRLSLAELRAFLDEHAPGVPDDQVMLNYATVVWETDPTEDELTQREQQRRRQAERQTEWERGMYEKLKAKFES